ncbi:MAG: hypothetical protein ACYTDW_11880 [Planctomycetota bacterium]|jgi:hypothetical protein
MFGPAVIGPVLHISSLIESPTLPARKNFYKCIDDMQQAFFLFKADVTKTIETAFNDLSKQSKKYRCCLLVLSDGKLADNQIRQIRRLATAYSARKWPFCFTATKQANRHLFVAGSQGEFHVALTHQANLPQWLEKIRTAIIGHHTEGEIRRSVKSTRTEKVEKPLLLDTISAKPLQKDTDDLTDTYDDTNTPRLPYILPVYPVPEHKWTPPSPNDIAALVKPKAPVKPKNRAKGMLLVLRRNWPLALTIGGVVLGAIILLPLVGLLRARSSSKLAPLLDQDNDTSVENHYRLMAYSNDKTYDLGEEASISSLIIGKDPGSPIPITNEDVDGQLFKIFKQSRKLKIKNIGGQPLMVNGISLKRGQKQDLFLPATIELTKNLKIDLYHDLIETEGQDLEFEGEET